MNAQAPGTQPPVAVCIPAHGNPEALSRLLTSLQALDHPRDLLQVVVAVDGPDATLSATAESFGATTVVLPVNGGSYAARNAALAVVRPDATAVLFTDTDCVVGPRWVTEHLRALEHADASGGAVRLTTSTPPRAAEWVDASRHLRQRHFVEALGFAATCNLAVRRDVVDALRFDASLRSGGDFDFGQRLAAAGRSLVYTEDAWVTHPARSSSAQLLGKVRRVAMGAATNEVRGHQATARREPGRAPALQRARLEGVDRGGLWRLQVRALELACSVVYARHVPSVVVPAVRRRLGRTA